MYKKSEKLKLIRQRLEAGYALLLAVSGAGLKSPYTLTLWRKKRPLIDRYMLTCLARCDNKRVSKVEDALYINAIEGNTVAQIFWLTNRKSSRWSDKRALVNNKQVNIQVNGKLNSDDREKQGALLSRLDKYFQK